MVTGVREHENHYCGAMAKASKNLQPTTGKPARRRSLEAEELSVFDHVADSVLEKVTLIRTNLLPPAADGMTVGRFVLLRGDQISRRGSKLMAHELVHVRQFSELGPVRFLVGYFGSYLKNLWRTRNHRQAYLDIPFEIEAREEADRWAAAHS